VVGRGSLVAAALLTLLNYAVLTCFDQLAFSSLGLRASRWRVGIVSFLGYAVSNCVSPAIVSGSAVRYRYYSRWGLTAEQIARVVVFYSSTFWLGLLVLGGAALVTAPAPALTAMVPGPWLALSGAVLFLLAGAYAAVPILRGAPVRVGRWEFPVPHRSTVVAQFMLSTLDWVLAASVLWVLLPAPRPGFMQTGGAFVGAQLIGLASHVPGGIGVFESLMLLFMRPSLAPSQMAPALVAYRTIYYLAPFALAMTAIAVDESRRGRSAIGRAGSLAASIGAWVTPKLLAGATFVAGTILILSGATPAIGSRLSWVARFVPFALLEASHFLGSIVGVGLLFLARAVARRIDAAWTLSVAGVAAGVVTSLLKGGDYEEAGLLAILLCGLLASRHRFDRKAALFDTPGSGSWFIGVIAVVAASIFLGTFAFRHVNYSNELWWRFALDADAPRFLRASVGAGVTILAFGLRHLLKPAPPDLRMPGEADLAQAEHIIGRQPCVSSNLAFMGDKALLWNADRSGFVMYAVRGRTWVALHDPVGPAAAIPALIRAFLERVDKFGGVPVFYEVRPEFLHRYTDIGFALVKIGEEAMVPLDRFTLEGGSRKGLRSTINRLEREGVSFRTLPGSEVRARAAELREVSNDWLFHKHAAEKGFSLGFFDPAYLERFPLAVLERHGRIEAFANVWASGGQELSVDLTRYRASAPVCAMEGLFVHLLRWGQQHGYGRFSLGVAPLSGLEPSTLSPPWTPVVRYLYEHGEAFYNFQGLRAYKEKFDPEWEPRYLAYPGRLALARVVADVSALIAGGYRRIFFKAS
jgi:phosphatidylglycerol lysyltransferase